MATSYKRITSNNETGQTSLDSLLTTDTSSTKKSKVKEGNTNTTGEIIGRNLKALIPSIGAGATKEIDSIADSPFTLVTNAIQKKYADDDSSYAQMKKKQASSVYNTFKNTSVLGDNIKNWENKVDEQQQSIMTDNPNSKLAEYAYKGTELAESAGRMIPTIAVSSLTGLALGAKDAAKAVKIAELTGTAAQKAAADTALSAIQKTAENVGLGAMWLGVYDSQYDQAVEEGKDYIYAGKKAFVDATLEVATEKMFGGIAGLASGESALGKVVSKVSELPAIQSLKTVVGDTAAGQAVANISARFTGMLSRHPNLLYKLTGQTVVNGAITGEFSGILGEAVEEMVSETFGPGLERLVTGDKTIENANLGQVLEAGLGGALLSIAMSPARLFQNVATADTKPNTSGITQQYQTSDENVVNLINSYVLDNNVVDNEKLTNFLDWEESNIDKKLFALPENLVSTFQVMNYVPGTTTHEEVVQYAQSFSDMCKQASIQNMQNYGELGLDTVEKLVSSDPAVKTAAGARDTLLGRYSATAISMFGTVNLNTKQKNSVFKQLGFANAKSYQAELKRLNTEYNKAKDEFIKSGKVEENLARAYREGTLKSEYGEEVARDYQNYISDKEYISVVDAEGNVRSYNRNELAKSGYNDMDYRELGQIGIPDLQNDVEAIFQEAKAENQRGNISEEERTKIIDQINSRLEASGVTDVKVGYDSNLSYGTPARYDMQTKEIFFNPQRINSYQAAEFYLGHEIVHRAVAEMGGIESEAYKQFSSSMKNAMNLTGYTFEQWLEPVSRSYGRKYFEEEYNRLLADDNDTRSIQEKQDEAYAYSRQRFLDEGGEEEVISKFSSYLFSSNGVINALANYNESLLNKTSDLINSSALKNSDNIYMAMEQNRIASVIREALEKSTQQKQAEAMGLGSKLDIAGDPTDVADYLAGRTVPQYTAEDFDSDYKYANPEENTGSIYPEIRTAADSKYDSTEQLIRLNNERFPDYVKDFLRRHESLHEFNLSDIEIGYSVLDIKLGILDADGTIQRGPEGYLEYKNDSTGTFIPIEKMYRASKLVFDWIKTDKADGVIRDAAANRLAMNEYLSLAAIFSYMDIIQTSLDRYTTTGEIFDSSTYNNILNSIEDALYSREAFDYYKSLGAVKPLVGAGLYEFDYPGPLDFSSQDIRSYLHRKRRAAVDELGSYMLYDDFFDPGSTSVWADSPQMTTDFTIDYADAGELDRLFRPQESTTAGQNWYDKIVRVIEKKPIGSYLYKNEQGKTGFIRELAKQENAVSQEELEYSGALDYLNTHESATREELLEYINDHMFRLTRVGNNHLWKGYSTIKEGENLGGSNHRGFAYVNDNLRYQNQHSYPRGTLVHARVTDHYDAEGNKYLAVEEVQSDIHNHATIKVGTDSDGNTIRVGYMPKDIDGLKAETAIAKSEADKARQEYRKVVADGEPLFKKNESVNRKMRRILLSEYYSEDKVPDYIIKVADNILKVWSEYEGTKSSQYGLVHHSNMTRQSALRALGRRTNNFGYETSIRKSIRKFTDTSWFLENLSADEKRKVKKYISAKSENSYVAKNYPGVKEAVDNAKTETEDYYALRFAASDALSKAEDRFSNLKSQRDNSNYLYTDTLADHTANKRLPDAPYKRGKYVDYALKDLVMLAAAEGYDGVIWTPAEYQAKRWNEEYIKGYINEYDNQFGKFFKTLGNKIGFNVEQIDTVGRSSSYKSREYTVQYINNQSIPSEQQEVFNSIEHAELALSEGLENGYITLVGTDGTNDGLEVYRIWNHDVDTGNTITFSVNAVPKSTYSSKTWPGVKFNDEIRERINNEGMSRFDISGNEYLSPENEKAYNDAINRYGTIPNSDIPRQTSDGTRVSQFSRNVSGLNLTPETKAEVIRMIMDGEFDYTPLSNAASEQSAHRWFEKFDTVDVNGNRGIDAVAASNDYIAISDSVKSIDARDVAKGELAITSILEDIRRKGDQVTSEELNTWSKLVAAVARDGTRTGQALQAFSMLKKITPDGRLYYIQKTLEDIRTNLESIKADIFGSAKKQLDALDGIEETEEYKTKMQALLQAKTFQEMETAEQSLIDFIAGKIPPTITTRLVAWRYLSMLGNVRTHERNIISNAANYIASGLTNKLSGVAQDVFVKDPTAVRTATTQKASQEVKDFSARDWELMKTLYSTGGKNATYQTKIDNARKNFSDKNVFGKTLEKLYNFNDYWLSEEDNWFGKLAYRRAMESYITANHIDINQFSNEATKNNKQTLELLTKIRKYAMSEANKATYHEANILATKLNELEKASPLGALLVGGIAPFKKTPVNILKQGAMYTGGGIIVGWKQLKFDVKNGKVTTGEAVNNICQGLTGAGIVALGLFLKGAGMIKAGGSDDDREEYYDEMLGNQKYSITIGDQNYTVDWLTPISMPLFTGVSIMEAYENTANDEDDDLSFAEILGALGTAFDPLTNLSLLSGVNDALSAYGNDNKIAQLGLSAAESYITQFIPTVVGQVARVVDPTRRTTYASKESDNVLGSEGEKFLRRVAAKLPFVSQNDEAYIDQWGRTDERSSNIGQRIVDQMLVPWYRATNKTTEVDDQLAEVFAEAKTSTVLPSTPNSYYNINGETYYLDADEYTKVKTTVGTMSYKAVESLLNSTLFDTLSADDKADVISEAYSFARSYAKAEYATGNIEGFEPDSIINKVQTALDAGLTIGDYFIIKKQINKFEADKNSNGNTISGSKKKKQVQYLNNLGLTSDQMSVFF